VLKYCQLDMLIFFLYAVCVISDTLCNMLCFIFSKQYMPFADFTDSTSYSVTYSIISVKWVQVDTWLVLETQLVIRDLVCIIVLEVLRYSYRISYNWQCSLGAVFPGCLYSDPNVNHNFVLTLILPDWWVESVYY